MTVASPDIGVVVVSYDSLATLPACLDAVLACPSVQGVVVVDNGSQDGSFEWLRERQAGEPRLRVAQLPANPGFAAACNLGASLSPSPWLAFVNPDVLLPLDALAALRTLAVAHPGEVLVGACLKDAGGRLDPAVRRRDLRLSVLLAGAGGRGSLDVAADGTALQLVDAVSGALFLVGSDAFRRVGGFDEGYRLHVEDLDLCRRVREAGVTVAIANGVVALHHRGVSSQSRPFFVEWHKHLGLWRYWWRHESGGWRGLLAPVVLLALAARWLLLSVPRTLRRRKRP